MCYTCGEIIMTNKLSSISNTSERLHVNNSQIDIQDEKIYHCNENYCFSGPDLRIKNIDPSQDKLEDL